MDSWRDQTSAARKISTAARKVNVASRCYSYSDLIDLGRDSFAFSAAGDRMTSLLEPNACSTSDLQLESCCYGAEVVMRLVQVFAGVCLWSILSTTSSVAQSTPDAVTIFENVRIFDGKSDQLTEPRNVLVRGNRIEKISAPPPPNHQRKGHPWRRTYSDAGPHRHALAHDVGSSHADRSDCR